MHSWVVAVLSRLLRTFAAPFHCFHLTDCLSYCGQITTQHPAAIQCQKYRGLQNEHGFFQKKIGRQTVRLLRLATQNMTKSSGSRMAISFSFLATPPSVYTVVFSRPSQQSSPTCSPPRLRRQTRATKVVQSSISPNPQRTCGTFSASFYPSRTGCTCFGIQAVRSMV